MADRQQKDSSKAPPAAASRITDEESGTDGATGSESLRRSLFALDAMRKRGLIDEATWAERRNALLAADQAQDDSNHAAGGGNRDGS
jgi:hypothetical protein